MSPTPRRITTWCWQCWSSTRTSQAKTRSSMQSPFIKLRVFATFRFFAHLRQADLFDKLGSNDDKIWNRKSCATEGGEGLHTKCWLARVLARGAGAEKCCNQLCRHSRASNAGPAMEAQLRVALPRAPILVSYATEAPGTKWDSAEGATAKKLSRGTAQEAPCRCDATITPQTVFQKTPLKKKAYRKICRRRKFLIKFGTLEALAT